MKLLGVLREGTQAIPRTVNRATHKGQHIGIFNKFIRYIKYDAMIMCSTYVQAINHPRSQF